MRPVQRTLLSLFALAGVAVAASPLASGAMAETIRQIEEAPAPLPTDEIGRFCSNVVDAARDRRYALQAEELKRLEADIDARIAALEAKRTEYEEWLARRQQFMDMARDNIVEIYSKMRPDAAAERMAELDNELAAAILLKLDPRQAGIILNEMERKTAALLTGIMASAARQEDPS